jgi:hypothetical protein
MIIFSGKIDLLKIPNGRNSFGIHAQSFVLTIGAESAKGIIKIVPLVPVYCKFLAEQNVVGSYAGELCPSLALV